MLLKDLLTSNVFYLFFFFFELIKDEKDVILNNTFVSITFP